MVLPLPFGPTNPTRRPAVMMKFNPWNRRRPPISYETFCSSINRLVLRSVAEKSICAVLLRRAECSDPPDLVEAHAALSIRPALDFLVRAFAPRRSHSISE